MGTLARANADWLAAASSPNTQTILSPSLHRALEGTTGAESNRPVLLREPQLAELKGHVLADMAALGHAYHNRAHVECVVKQSRELAHAARLDPVSAQLLELAALFHDYGHAGNSYRQLVPSASRNDLSNEEYAVLKADEMIGSILSVQQRKALQGLILATSFGQSIPDRIPEQIRADAYRTYQPVSKLEKLLAFADVSGGLSDFDAFDADNAALIRESGPKGLPSSLDLYLLGRLGFLSYLEAKFNDVRDFLDPSSARAYASAIDGHRQRIDALRKDPNQAGASQMGIAFVEVAGE